VSVAGGEGGTGRADRESSSPSNSAMPAPGRTGTHPSTRFTSVEWSDRRMCDSSADDDDCDVTVSRRSSPGKRTTRS